MQDISPQIILLIGTLGGTLIGVMSSLITVFITKKYEEKKDYRKTLLETSIINWKRMSEFALKNGGTLFPLDSFIIYNSKLMNAISKNPDLSKDELKRLLDESHELMEIYVEKEAQHKKRDYEIRRKLDLENKK
ncbi:hypothetical protein KKA23_02765 [Patescibacteria group bacterium]|nr:hypothetical protein [Patescibacteria group bacterium]